MHYLLNVLKNNILFFCIGARIGASFRLMFIDIVKDIFIECFCKQTDAIRMRWKSDLRYWLQINLIYFPVMAFQLEPIQIPEKYVYIILARMIMKFKTIPNLTGDFNEWFKQNKHSLPIHSSTLNHMEVIIFLHLMKEKTVSIKTIKIILYNDESIIKDTSRCVEFFENKVEMISIYPHEYIRMDGSFKDILNFINDNFRQVDFVLISDQYLNDALFKEITLDNKIRYDNIVVFDMCCPYINNTESIVMVVDKKNDNVYIDSINVAKALIGSSDLSQKIASFVHKSNRYIKNMRDSW